LLHCCHTAVTPLQGKYDRDHYADPGDTAFRQTKFEPHYVSDDSKQLLHTYMENESFIGVRVC
jgi:hypothetical protein